MTPMPVPQQKLDARLAEAVNDLVDVATASHDTLIRAVHWLLYTWRSAPDVFELDVRTRAVQRLVARMSDTEHAVWRDWVAIPPLERPPIHTL